MHAPAALDPDDVAARTWPRAALKLRRLRDRRLSRPTTAGQAVHTRTGSYVERSSTQTSCSHIITVGIIAFDVLTHRTADVKETSREPRSRLALSRRFVVGIIIVAVDHWM